MQTIKMISLISVMMLLTGCTMTKINQSEELTGDEMTGEVITGIVDSGVINDDTISGDIEETTTGATVPEVNANTTETTEDKTVAAEDSTLKEKIRNLIEQRKIESKATTKLTEEDIQLMEDVLKTIVNETSK